MTSTEQNKILFPGTCLSIPRSYPRCPFCSPRVRGAHARLHVHLNRNVVPVPSPGCGPADLSLMFGRQGDFPDHFFRAMKFNSLVLQISEPKLEKL